MSSSARILVVDDERSMREFLEILLRKEGYDVTTAGDVDSALLALDSDDYDLVVTDIRCLASRDSICCAASAKRMQTRSS